MIHTKTKPHILDIKPVEQVVEEVKKEENVSMESENFDLPQLDEEDHLAQMFQKPTPTPQPQQVQSAPVVKKKKVLSEKQRAHLERMRAKKAKITAERNKAKKQLKEEKKQQRQEELKRKIENNRNSVQPQSQQRATPIQVESAPQPNQSNQAYMKDFFQNLNMFMESYNKVNTARGSVPQQTQISTKKPLKQSAPVQNNKPQKFSVLNPYVNYRGVRRPFGR